MHEEEVHARRDATVVVPRPVAPRKSVASTMASLRFCSSAAAKAKGSSTGGKVQRLEISSTVLRASE